MIVFLKQKYIFLSYCQVAYHNKLLITIWIYNNWINNYLDNIFSNTISYTLLKLFSYLKYFK